MRVPTQLSPASTRVSTVEHRKNPTKTNQSTRLMQSAKIISASPTTGTTIHLTIATTVQRMA